MSDRVWSTGDRVAVRDRIDQPWRLGTVTNLQPAGWVACRLDEPAAPDIRHPDDVRLVPADQVPVDERSWLPEKVRDQLARQEAAGRLRAMCDDLTDLGVEVEYVRDVANWLDDLLADPEGVPALAAAARALLAPAPQPATTP